MGNKQILEIFWQSIEINCLRFRRKAKKVKQILINITSIILTKILLQLLTFQISSKATPKKMSLSISK